MNLIRTSRWAALAVAAAMVGCGDTAGPDASAPTANPTAGAGAPVLQAPESKPTMAKPAGEKAADAAPAKKLDIAGAKLTEKDLANVSKLDEADRKVALEQKLCPNTGARLGTMGKPVKVTLKGQPVFLCCESCEEEVKAKPDEALAKLGR